MSYINDFKANGTSVVPVVNIGVGTNNIVHDCINATDLYLEYSSEKEPQKQGSSQDIINVLSNKPKVTEDGDEIYELEIGKQLKSNEFLLRDKHYEKEYMANEDFTVILPDRKNNKVFIKFKDPSALLHTGFSPNIELSFDLRVLIMNQRTIYKNHSFDIARPQVEPMLETPTGYQYVRTHEHPNMPVLNTEQKQAVSTMLTQPISFIKGPPGVGKTLTESVPIISYMAVGLPVAIVTPTHVSLDRSLSTINEICKRVGIV